MRTRRYSTQFNDLSRNIRSRIFRDKPSKVDGNKICFLVTQPIPSVVFQKMCRENGFDEFSKGYLLSIRGRCRLS